MRQFPALVLFLFLSFTPLFAQSPNDECATALVISSLPFHHTQDTRLATPNVTDPAITCQDSIANGKTVWFRYSTDSLRTVLISTIGSEPMEDYDVTLSVFTGSCGDLHQVRCNDDTLDTRQSAVTLTAQPGVLYHIMVGEWGGGGTNGGEPTGGDLEFSVTAVSLPALFRGPRTGIANNGVTTNTDNFLRAATTVQSASPREKRNENERFEKLPAPPGMKSAAAPYGTNHVEDGMRPFTPVSRPVALQGFTGVPQTNFIPPDPILAVGPQHVMAAVNSAFRIYKKDGTLQKSIDADQWFDQVADNVSTFDPIVMYDHFSHRWIFLMLHEDDATATSYQLLGISDDDDPNGLWYNWALPGSAVGDSVTSNWSDYARLGVDENAVYITSNQFGFDGTFHYCKLRVIPKAALLQNNAHAITFHDLWDFRDPDNLNTTIFGLRPSITFGSPGRQFLLNDSPYFLGTFFTLWSLDSVLTHPTISAVNIPVTTYFPAPDAGQLGGGALELETGGSDIRNEPVYRDSTLYTVHTIASGANKEYSSIRLLAFDPFGKKVKNDLSFGLNGYWHSYPALMVNQSGDMTLTFSRSGTDEYNGAFMTGRKRDDPPGLAPSITLREGRGNYVVDYNSGRNRWGDYSGIALDPADERTIWTHTEFAASKDAWGTWIARTTMGPVAGSHLTADRSYINFGTKNTGTSSDTVTIRITNDGMDSLRITALITKSKNFRIVSPTSLPAVVGSLGTLDVKVCFLPVSSGPMTDSILYCDSQNCTATTVLASLSGTGFQIMPAQPGIMYAASGSTDGGKLYRVSPFSGAIDPVSVTGLGQVASLRIHPVSKELYALDPTATSAGGTLYRISLTGASTAAVGVIPVTNLKGMDFLNDTVMVMGDFNGRIFLVDIKSMKTRQLATTGLRISGLAVHPVTRQVWFCLRATSGAVDAIYTFDTTTSAITKRGETGLGTANADLVFDKNGVLYLLSGTNAFVNKLSTVDTASGHAIHTVDLGKSNILSIALDPSGVAAVPSLNTVPHEFSLQQNYPNPFNPFTQIRYSLPERQFITLTVFDALGREVQTLAEGIRSAGDHVEYFDGSACASGVYYYRIRAGKEQITKKMLLTK